MFILDHIKYCLFSYGHRKLFEPTAFFFHPQIWGKYPINFYFVLSNEVSKSFEKSSYLFMLITVPLFWGILKIILFFTSGDLSVSLLPGDCVGWSSLWISENGDIPFSEVLFFCYCFSHYMATTSRAFVIVLWNTTAEGMSACSHLLAQGQLHNMHSCYSLELL